MVNKLNINQSKKQFIIYIVLTVVTLAVYWQVNQFDFINYDDDNYITENTIIQSGITFDGIRWAFCTKDLFLWHPLVWLSFMLDYQLYGLNAGGYHLTNLILHILSTLLLFWLFNRMTGAVWKSAFVAAFFALHPLHVESVAWVSERKDVLSAFFWILTLCLYVYYTGKPALRRYLLVLFSFVLALMSKPTAIMLPVIIILLDYWPLKRFDLKKDNFILWQLKEKVPFFILSVIIYIVNYYINLYNLNKIVNLYSLNKLDTPLQASPLSSRLANASVAFISYLEKTFWPNDMSVFYPFPDQIPLLQVLGATFLIIVITTFIVVMAKRMPYIFVGWLWYAITIVPIIGMIQTSKYFFMADRYHYLPSIGIAVGLAWSIPSLFNNKITRRNILFTAAIVFFIFLSVLSWKQCGYWKDSATLFSHSLQITNNNYLAHNNLGLALAKEGKDYAAIYHYNKAISLNQQQALPYFNRGCYYGKTGQYQLALNDFNKAISLDNAFVKAYNNRGIVHTRLNLYRKAIDDFNEAIRLNPDYTDALNNRAFVYLNVGNTESGCRDAKKSCKHGNCKSLDWANRKGFCS